MNSHLQTLRHFYEELKGSELNVPDLVSCLEIRYSIFQLARFFEEAKDCPETKSQSSISNLNDFLAARWKRIQGTNLSYVHSLQLPITAFCIQAAAAIAAENKMNEYDLLMPGLNLKAIDVATNEPSYKTLENHSSQLHEFIVSDDNKRLISVSAALEYAIPDKTLKHNQLIDDKIESLTETESSRIINHSKLANDFYNAIENLYKITHEGHSIGTAIQRLINKLRQGGIYQSKQVATPRDIKSEKKENFKIQEFNSGADANEGIFEFHQFLQILTDEEKQNLFERKAHGITDNFGKCWQRLARGNIFKEYYLALMSTKDLKEKAIEFRCEQNGLKYRVIGLDKQEKKDLIKWEYLPQDFPRTEELILANKDKTLMAILKIAAEKGHTLKENGFDNAESTYCVEITANNIESILLENKDLFTKQPSMMIAKAEAKKNNTTENKNESKSVKSYQENVYRIAEDEVQNYLLHFQKRIKKLDYIVTSNYGNAGTECLWKQLLIQAKDNNDLNVLFKVFNRKPAFTPNSLDLKAAITLLPETSELFAQLDLFTSFDSIKVFVRLISPEKRLNNLMLINKASLENIIRSNKQLIAIVELLKPTDVVPFLYFINKNHLEMSIMDINELFDILPFIPKHQLSDFAKNFIHLVKDIASLKKLLDICSDNQESQSSLLSKVENIQWERFIGDIECLNTILESSLNRLHCMNQIKNEHFSKLIENASDDLFVKFLDLIFNAKVNENIELKSEIKFLPAHRRLSSLIENKIDSKNDVCIEAILNSQIRPINQEAHLQSAESKVSQSEVKSESKSIDPPLVMSQKNIIDTEKWIIILKKFSEKPRFEFLNQAIKYWSFDNLIKDSAFFLQICNLLDNTFAKKLIETHSNDIQKLLDPLNLDTFGKFIEKANPYNRVDIIKATGKNYLNKIFNSVDDLCNFLKIFYKSSALEILQNFDLNHLGSIIYKSDNPRNAFLRIIDNIYEDHISEFLKIILTSDADAKRENNSAPLLKTQLIKYFFTSVDYFLDLLKKFSPSTQYPLIILLDTLIYQNNNHNGKAEYKSIHQENIPPGNHSTFLRLILHSSKNNLNDYHQLINILMHQYTNEKLLKMKQPYHASNLESLSISQLIKLLHTDNYYDYPVLQMIHLHYLLMVYIKQQQLNEFKNATCSIFSQTDSKSMHAALLLLKVLNREANFCDLSKYKKELNKGDLDQIYKRLHKVAFFKQLIQEDQASFSEQMELRSTVPTLKPNMVNGLFR